MITQSELKEKFHYDPNTGLLKKICKTKNYTPRIDSFGWKGNGYLNIVILKQRYLAHRLAWLYMTGEWPEQIDHINHIKDDNRWSNLREVTNQENAMNRKLRKDNKSGCTGIHWHKSDLRWYAIIRVANELKYLGSFKYKFDAICVRKSAELKYGFHENHGK